MYNLLLKRGQTIAFVLGLIVIAIFLGSAFMGLGDAGYGLNEDLNKLPAEVKSGIDFFNPGLMLTVVLAVIAFVLAFVVFGVLDLVRFPKSAVRTLIGLAVIAVVFFALYSTSAVETVGKLGDIHQQFDISNGVSKFISGGLKTTLGLLGLSVLLMVVFELRNAFK